MCGIIGCIGQTPVVEKIYNGLLALQHRGQDAAGIATFSDCFHLKKGNGLVADVFREKNIRRLSGLAGIGHVRYPTIGAGTVDDAQPFFITVPYGIALAHNGNLVNYHDLRQQLSQEGLWYLNSHCDAEVILTLLARELKRMKTAPFKVDHLFRALRPVYRALHGSYSVVALIGNKGMLAFRDPRGIKPLVFGRRRKECCVASESVALDLLNYPQRQDVPAGAAIFIDGQGRAWQKQIVPARTPAACIFEYIYFARPDSVIDGIGVYEARLRLGQELAVECRRLGLRPDVVIPVPDTARGAAQMVAEGIGVRHREGLIKNRYIHRTFIMPSPAERSLAVRLKLNPIRDEIAGKRVLLVDDSIVRGTTSREIIKMVRTAGARKVFYALYAPPLKYPCVYGIDMQTRGEFIARHRSLESICRQIGADQLIYQSIAGMIRGVGAGQSGFCTACFTGEYPTSVPPRLMKGIEKERKKKKDS